MSEQPVPRPQPEVNPTQSHEDDSTVSETFQPTAAQTEAMAETGRMSLPQLMWRRFLRNRLAVIGSIGLILLYLMIVFAEFLSPYEYLKINEDTVRMAPQWPRFVDVDGNFHLRPFACGTETTLDTVNLAWIHTPDCTQMYPIHLFVRGYPYKLFGLIATDIHLFGTESGKLFLMGADQRGRDLFSRIIYGGRVSLTIGFLGVFISVVLGSVIGAISGYRGGTFDMRKYATS